VVAEPAADHVDVYTGLGGSGETDPSTLRASSPIRRWRFLATRKLRSVQRLWFLLRAQALPLVVPVRT
jgi:hypothetical protein